MEQQWTRSELEQQDSSLGTLIIIDNVVYDVTLFLDDHPGGPEVLKGNAGLDASQCFRDVGHSDEARRLMLNYRAGTIHPDEHREEIARRSETFSTSSEPITLSGLLDVWGPPLMLGAVAVLMYMYLFA